MKRPKWLIISLLLGIVGNTLFFTNTSARSFDPGYIISDSIFTNSTAMSADSLQRFISAKGVYCTDGEAPCLKNFTENGKSAGTIIAEAALANSVNPQVLLVTLQKETGLVTLNKPAAWRYRTAMGYGCPDTEACDSTYYGFTNQVHNAASMFHRIMTYDPTWYSPYQIGVNSILFNPNMACGQTSVNIVNRATAALYDYTPYQPNAAALAAGYGTGDSCSAYGNRNFWLYFNDWFGSSVSSMLIMSAQSPAVYLQSGNTRYSIPSWDVISAYGFGRFGVTAVSDNYMNSLINGGVLSTVFTNKNEPGPVYLADNGYRFGFTSYQQCVNWGFPGCTNPAYAKPIEPSLLDQMYTYGALSPIMLNGSHVHLMINGEKHTFLSHQARVEQGYGSIHHTPITNPLNTSQKYSNSIPQNNSFVSFSKNPAIYAYTNGRYYVLSSAAFDSLKSQNTPILIDNFSKYTVTPPESNGLIKPYISFSDGSAYSLAQGEKIDISAVKHEWPIVPVVDDMKNISDRKPISAIAGPISTYRTAEGSIARIESSQWRVFYNLSDYFTLGYNSPLPVDSGLLAYIPSGQPIFAPGYGSLYQLRSPNSPSLIFTNSADNTVCQVHNLSQMGLYGFSTSSVPRIEAPYNNTINLLSSTVYDETGAMHIRHNNVRSVISAEDLASRWGISMRMPLCSFSRDFLSKKPINQSSPKFVRDERTGVIYYGEGGVRRAIYSYDAFLRMGGGSWNTQNISVEFLNASPEGSPIL